MYCEYCDEEKSEKEVYLGADGFVICYSCLDGFEKFGNELDE